MPRRPLDLLGDHDERPRRLHHLPNCRHQLLRVCLEERIIGCRVTRGGADWRVGAQPVEAAVLMVGEAFLEQARAEVIRR
jgi:hypothetical protein